ncbi:MAG: radical SAM protein, partial [Flavobacteriales bacterium]|nr:radical SAM protein [Flavobacteriales bacterium]
QNVDSYKWKPGPAAPEAGADGARNVDSLGRPTGSGAEGAVDFADLLEMVALACPTLRIRYSTSHPKDMTDKVLEVMARHTNICKYIHLPVQSGSSAVLERMNRGYTREWYQERVASIRRHMPDCAISTDVITGFCGETDADHAETLSLMEQVGYDMAFMFKYSERPKTLASRKYPDDVPEELKGRRLQEVIEMQKLKSAERMAGYVGQVHEVLIEGVSKRSAGHMYGRNSQNSIVIVPRRWMFEDGRDRLEPGDMITVTIVDSTAGSLKGAQVLEEVTQ